MVIGEAVPGNGRKSTGFKDRSGYLLLPRNLAWTFEIVLQFLEKRNIV